jgi:SAM-dependent methyltransferase
LACPTCRARLYHGAERSFCPSCGRGWRREGIVRVPETPAGALDPQSDDSRRFFDELFADHDHAPRSDVDPHLSGADPLLRYLDTAASRDIAKDVLALVGRPSVRTVADLGCGSGAYLATAVRAGRSDQRFVGVDVSLAGLRRAAKRIEREVDSPSALHDRVVLSLAEGGPVPIVDDAVDLVLLTGVLHHAGTLALVGEAARILAPSGYLYLADISGRNPCGALARAALPLLPRSLRISFGGGMCPDGAAPGVKLVDPDALTRYARDVGLRQVEEWDHTLFFFLLYYAALAAPGVARRIPAAAWNLALRAERAALHVESFRHMAMNIVRLYRYEPPG